MPSEKGDRPDLTSENLDLIQSLKDENAQLRAKFDRTQILLNGLADASPDIFWQTDENHRFTYFSRAVRTLCGHAVSAPLGKTRAEIAHGETNTDDWRRHFDDLRKLRPFKLFSYNIKHSSGEIRHVVTSGRPSFDDTGKFTGYIGIARDVTEQVTERNRLVATEENLLQAINSLNASVTLWDADDRLITFNDHFRMMNVGLLGYSEPGITFEEYIRASADKRLKVEPAELENWVQWRLARHRNPREQFEAECKDGKTVLVNEAKLENGGIITVVSDITALKVTERALRASEQRLRDFGSVAADWVWEMGPDLRFTYFSEHMKHQNRFETSAMIGKTRREIGIENVSEDKLAQHEADLAAHRTFYDFRYSRTHKDGRRVHTSISGKPIFDDDGSFLGYRGIGRDITETVHIQNELRAAKERAEQASRAKSEFLAHMSHEFRTPLNAILGFSEIIKTQVFGPIGNESYTDYAQDIHTSGEHLLSLINDLLDLSKIEAGKFEIFDEDLDIAEMLQQTERYFRQRFAARGIAHTMRVAPEAAYLRADRRALSQLLFNLLSNAEKYNRENGRIETTVCLSEDGCCQITVSDSGFGFDATDYETAIAPFGRIENPMTTVSGGTGLGLPIVNGLMHLHGGRVDIESEMEVGTIVSLIFPQERVVRKDA